MRFSIVALIPICLSTVLADSVVPISEISDGQIQATTVTAPALVSQITDGQIQATEATVTNNNGTTVIVQPEGAGNKLIAADFAAGLIAVAAMLV